GAPRTVAEMWRDDEPSRAADLHPGHAFVPALDHLPTAQREFERLVAVPARIEFRAGLVVLVQPAGVVDLDALARLCGIAAAAGRTPAPGRMNWTAMSIVTTREAGSALRAAAAIATSSSVQTTPPWAPPRLFISSGRSLSSSRALPSRHAMPRTSSQARNGTW